MKTASQRKREHERKAALKKSTDALLGSLNYINNFEHKVYDGYVEYVHSTAATRYDDNTDEATKRTLRFRNKYGTI